MVLLIGFTGACGACAAAIGTNGTTGLTVGTIVLWAYPLVFLVRTSTLRPSLVSYRERERKKLRYRAASNNDAKL